MPKKLHRKLVKQYRAKGLRGEELDHAVYGTMTNIEKGKRKKKRSTSKRKSSRRPKSRRKR